MDTETIIKEIDVIVKEQIDNLETTGNIQWSVDLNMSKILKEDLDDYIMSFEYKGYTLQQSQSRGFYLVYKGELNDH